MRIRTHRQSAATLSLCAGLGVLLSAASPALATAREEEWYDIKLRINIYKMAGVTKAQAKDIVKVANGILKQAMIRLDLVDKCIKEDVDPPGGDDGSFSEADIRQAIKDGKKEIGEGKGKGLKVGFGKEIDDANTNGISILCHPTILQRKHPTGGDAKSGETMAHELCHALGIDHVAGNDNIMSESSRDRTATTITADQATALKKKAKDVGVPIKKKKGGDGASPAGKTAAEHGAKAGSDTPPLRGGADYQNLDFARVSSVFGDTEYRLMLDLGGLIPDAPTAPTDYLFLFDADDDDMTGSTLHGRMGIDSVVRAHAESASNITFSIENGDGSGSTPILGALMRGNLENEVEEPGGLFSIPMFDQLNISVPRSMLTLTGGDLLDVGVVTEDTFSGVTDDFDLTLDRLSHTRGPSLLTDEGTYEPGQTMTLQGFGFQPFEPLEILLDDTLLGMVSADASGAFNTFVNAPMGLDSTFYFLSAHPTDLIALAGGSSSESGTTVVNIPAPATVMLSIAGIVLAAGRRRPR